MKNIKGFTIIELIVVIAIIAVLAGIVLVNVTQYINKGKDAAIKADLANLITQSTVYFSDPVNSGKKGNDFIASPSAQSIMSAAGDIDPSVGALGGSITKTDWVYCQYLTTPGKRYCVDSRGNKKEVTDCDDVGQVDITTTYSCL
jgi:prepilin-type N-terminal cleavage/methylation domain-containing protein